MREELLTIEQAAKELGVSTKTMRRWDMSGKLSPKRTVGNHRRYTRAEIDAFKAQKGNLTSDQASAPASTQPAPSSQPTLASQPVQPTQQPQAASASPARPAFPTLATAAQFAKEKEESKPVVDEIVDEDGPEIAIEKDVAASHFALPHMNRRGVIMSASSMVAMLFLLVISINTVPHTRMFAEMKQKVSSMFPGANEDAATTLNTPIALRKNNENPNYNLRVNVPAIFGKKTTFLDDVEIKKNLTVSGKLTAPNIVYSLVAGQNVTISGDPQRPTISAGTTGGVSSFQGQTGAVALTTGSGIGINGLQVTNTGVLSVQGQTGDVQFSTGNGLSLSGTTFTNTDPGSAQTIFKNFTLDGTTTITADSNTDTINFAAGSGVTLAGNTSTKTITISAAGGTSSQWTTTGSNIYYTAGNVGIGTSTPTSTLDVAGGARITGSLNLTSSSNQIVLGNGTTGTITLAGLTGSRTYTFPDASGEICLNSGNCSGLGGALTGAGTTNYIPKFTSSSGIGDSSIYDNGHVGIGTTSPLGLFSVSGAVAGNALVSLNETGDQNILVGSASGTTRFFFDRSGDLNIIGGTYQINGTTVLSTTSLGTGVTSSSLTSVGALSNGSISSGFGSISTTNTITGTTLNGTTGINTGVGAGTVRIDASGNLSNIGNINASGTTTLSALSTGIVHSNSSGVLSSSAVGLGGADVTGTLGVTNGGTGLNSAAIGDLLYGSGVNAYSRLGIGNGGQVLTVVGGLPAWVDPSSLSSSYWQRSLGLLSPTNITDDFAIGGTATNSAKFQIFGLTGNATSSGNLTFNAASSIQTTKNQTLTIGGSSTGNIVFSPQNGAGTVTVNGNLNLASGDVYQINGTSVLSSNALGSGVTNSSLTSVGALASGSIATGFGTIATNNSISGSTLGIGGTTVIDNSRNAVNLVNLTASGTITFSGVSNGIAHIASGVVTGSAVNLASSDVTGTLGAGNGGTGFATYTTGDLLYGNGSTTLSKLGIGNAGQILTVSGGLPAWMDAGGTINFFQRANGAIAPLNISDDILVGGAATNSAKFQISGTTGNASTSGNLTFNSAASLQTTNNQTLTLGGTTTGNIVFSPQNGAGTVTVNGNMNLASGNVYTINGTTVLSSNTLGSGVLTSSLTSVGTLNAGSISTGFGNIDVGIDSIAGGDFTSVGTTGFTLSGNGADITFSGLGNHDITASAGTLGLGAVTLNGDVTGNNKNLTGLTNLSAGGTITFSGVSNGIAHVASGVITGSAVDLASEVTGTLGVSNGGTGTGSVGSAGGVAYSDGTKYAFTAVGNSGQILRSNGSSAPTWVDVAALTSNYWQENGGLLSPTNITDDLAIGGTATSSAKFQIFGLTGNATTSGNLTFNGASSIQTTNNQTLTIGGASTGNIVFSPQNGAGTVTVNGNMNLATGDVYQINGTTVLSNNTLGSGVTTSSLTTVGALANGSIATGFGTIATNNSISGSTLGIGGTTVIDNSRNAVNLANVTASGTITFSGLGQGIAHLSSGGVVSSSAVALGGSEVTGTLGVGNGGTGIISYNSGDLLYGNGSNTLSTLAKGSDGQILSLSSGLPTWMSTSSLNYWQRANGEMTPLNITDDLLLGSTATDSAKFAFTGVAGGTPTASISANSGNNATYLTGDGTLGTTNKQTLTIGSPSTGKISLSGFTSGVLHTDGSGYLSASAIALGSSDVTGTLGVGNGGTGINGSSAGNGTLLIGNGSGYTLATLTQGTGIGISNGSGTISISNSGVTSLTGTANQINVSGSTGAVTLSLPQDIATSSTPTFAAMNLTNNTNQLVLGTSNTGTITMATLTSGRTYTLPDASGVICLDSGNCGTGGGVTASGATTNRLVKFTGTSTIANGSINDLYTGGVALTIDASGNLGIGNTTPGGVLDVKGGTTGGNAAAIFNQTGASTNDIFTASASGTTEFTVNNNGSIQFNGGSGFLQTLTSTAVAGKTYNFPTFTGSSADICLSTGNCSGSGGGLTGSGTTGQVAFFTGTGTIASDTNLNYDATNGLLGIGNASPVARLDVAGGVKGKALSIFNETGDQNILVGSASGATKFAFDRSGNLNLTSGAYQIGGSSVLNSTTLGSSVVNSSLTSVGALASGSIASGFGAITTTNTITGNTFSINGTNVIDASRNITNAANLTASGTITLSGLSTGIAHFSAGGVISSSAVDLASGDVTGVLGVSNGGTGVGSVGSAGSLAYSDGSKYAFTGVGTSGFVLKSNGSSAPTWVDISTLVTNYWQRNGGLLAPANITDDFAVGGTATGSAKFQVFGLTGNATSSGNLTFDGASSIQTTKNQTLTLGGTTTGNIVFSPQNGAGTVTVNGNMNLASGDVYQINGTTVLSNNTLGSGVTTSSLTTVGALASGSIATGFGTIATNNSISGSTLGIGGTTVVDNSRNAVNLANVTASGTITFSGLGAGIAHFSSGGVVSSSAVGLASSDVTGTLGVGNGGTGLTTYNEGDLLIGNASNTLSALPRGSAGQFLTVSGSTLVWSDAAGAINFWQRANGVLSPLAITDDLALGGTATSSAKFQVFGTTGNATTSGTLTFDAAGVIQTTKNQTLTLGGASTGNIVFSPQNGAGTVTVNGNMNLASGNVYQINGTSVLSNNTLGSGVTTSSLTTVGALANGSIAAGFGTISTSNSISGSTLGISGTTVIDASRNLSNIAGVGTNLLPTANNTYGIGASGNQYASIYGQTLYQNGSQVCDTSGNCSGLSVNFWNEANGALTPKNSTEDFLIGGQASSSAKFAILNMNSGTPTASLSAGTSGGAYLSAAGTLQTTANQTLTLGGNTTGNIVFSPLNGSGTVTVNGTMNLASSNVYQISGTTVLSSSALGTGVTGSSLTSVGALASGSIATGFGTIATNNSISGSTLGIGGTTVIDNSRNIGNAVNLTASGTITFSGLGQGIAHLSSGGVLSSSAVALGGSDVTGTLGAGNGGTGHNTYTYGDLLFGNNSGGLDLLPLGGPNQYLTAVGGVLSWTDANGSINFWQKANGTLAPLDITNDLLIGGAATSSAKFQIFGLTGNATSSGNLTFDGASSIQTTKNQTLTIGGNSTGNIVFSPQNGAGTVTVNGNMNLASGDVYQINGTTVLNNNTLGSGVTTSSLTTVGALANGSIASGFGTIATNNSISGSTLGIGGTTVVDNSRNAVNLANITASGTITFSGLSTGIAHLSSGGVVSSSAIDLATGDITGILGPTHGGTGLNSYTAGDLLYGNGTNSLATLAKGSDGQVLSLASGLPTWISTSSINYWQRASGVVAPLNITDDLLLGSTATSSAKFAFTNVAGGTPTASISANSGNNATYLSGAGVLGTTNAQSLTLGSASTGNVMLSPGGTNALTAMSNGNLVANGTLTGLTGLTSSGTIQFSSLTSNGLLKTSGGTGTVSVATAGTDYENPLTFSNGLTRTTNAIALGGTLTGNTDIPLAGNIFSLSGNGRVGIGTNSPEALLKVTGGYANNAAFIVNNTNSGNLIAASASGTTKFTIDGSGNLALASGANIDTLTTTGTINLAAGTNTSTLNVSKSGGTVNFASGSTINFSGLASNNNSVLYTGASGVLSAATTSSSNLCLISNGAGAGPTWGSCATGTTNYLQRTGTTIAPSTATDSLVLGGNTTTSNQFEVNGKATGKALVSLNETGDQNILVGSASGTTKFTFDRSGNLALAAGAGIDALTSGNLSIGTGSTTNTLSFGRSGQSITLGGYNNCGMLTTSGTTLTCSSAPITTTQYWQENAGAVAPANITDDLLLGATATTSAKFAFKNVAGGTPTASISANTANNATYLTGDGTLGTTNAQTLTIGSASTGNVLLSPGGSGQIQFFNSNNLITSAGAMQLASNLVVRGTTVTLGNGSDATIQTATNANLIFSPAGNGNTIVSSDPNTGLYVGSSSNTPAILSVNGGIGNNAAFIVNNNNNGNLIAASASGTTKFTVDGSGNLALVSGSNIDTLTSTGTINLAAGTNTSTLNLSKSGGTVNFASGSTINFSGLASNNNSVLYTGASGVLSAATTSTANLCLISNGAGAAPSWASCSTGVSNYIQRDSGTGTIAPSTASDKLVLGGNTTTNHQLEVNGKQTGKALVALNETGDQDIFTASAAGTTKFTINHSGDLVLGTTTRLTNAGVGTFAANTAISTVQFTANTISDTNGALNINANGSSLLTLQNVGTGNIQFFNGNNVLTSAGNLTLAGTTHTLGNGSAVTIQTSGSGASNLTLTAAGSGNTIVSSDADTGLYIGSSSNTPAVLSVNGGIGNNAAFIVNNTNSGNLIAASSAGTTKFTVANNGTVNIDTGATYNIAGTSVLSAGALGTGVTASSLTSVGALNAGSISSGFGAIDIGNDNLTAGGTITFAGLNAGGLIKSDTSGVLSVAAAGTDYQGVLSVSNGLTLSGSPANTLKLGGTLTGATNIALAGNNFSITGAGGVGIGSSATGNGEMVVNQANSAGDIFSASQSGTTKFTINNAGDVVLGTTTRITNAGVGTFANNTVVGTATFTANTITDAAALAITSTGSNTLTLQSAGTGNIQFFGSANTIDSSGNLSINGNGTIKGTSLSLGNGSNATIQTSSNADLSLLSSGTGSIKLGQNSGTGNVVVQPNAGGQAALIVNKQGATGDILTASIGGTTKFKIDSNGILFGYSAGNFTGGAAFQNLTVGTTAASTLQVNADSAQGNLTAYSSGYSGGGVANSVVLSSNSSSGGLILNTNTTAPIRFATNGIEKMRVDSAGNVGINATSPLAALDVRATTGTTPAASVSGATTNAAVIVDQSGTGDIFTASKSGATKFTINNAGNVVAAGTLTGLTGLTSSGTINFSGLGASAFVVTDGSKNLSTTAGAATSSELISILSDETGSGVAVFGTSPAITTSLTTGSTSFDLLNTTATTLNFGGAATAINAGASGGTLTLGNGGAFTTTTSSNGNLTIAANGSGNTILGQNSGNGTVLAQPNAGGQAAFIVNKQGSAGDIFTASTSGATKFTIDRSGNVAAVGTLGGSNFSGSSSGTNTGDITLDGTGQNYLTLTGQQLKANAINLSGTNVTSTLGVANGGTGTGTAFTQGSIVFAGGSGVYSQDNSNFFWDSANKRLGIGANTSLGGALDVRATSGTLPVFTASGATANAVAVVNQTGVGDAFTASVAGATKFTVANNGTVTATNKVVIGSTTNGISFDPSGAITQIYNGTAMPAKSITLSAEYPGAVLTASGAAATNGIMTSDASPSASPTSYNFENYYLWTSSQTDSIKSYTVAVRVTLPSDFGSWAASNPVQVDYNTSATAGTNANLNVYLYRTTSGTPIAYHQNLFSGGPWKTENISAAELNGGTTWNTAGQTAVFYLTMQAFNNAYVEVGDIKLNYNAKF